MFPNATFADGLFVLGFLLAAAWLASVVRFVRLMREHHPQKYEEMHLAEAFPKTLTGWTRGHSNHRPAAALLRFLWRREYEQLRDEKLARLASVMRGLLFCFVVVFALSFFDLLSSMQEAQREASSAAATRRDGPREKAFELHRQGRYAEAGRIYDELLGKAQADSELLYWRGVARRREGRHEDALADFRRVMDVDPRMFEAYRGADRILSDQKRFDDCIELWNRFLQLVPGHKDAVFERGGAHFRLGNFTAAQADAQRSCELGRQDACRVARDLRARMDDATRKAAP